MGLQRSACSSLFADFVVALILFTVGFSCPFWLRRATAVADIWSGLWQQCERNLVTDNTDCHSIDLSDQEVWFQATAGLMITALILAVFSGCFACLPPVSGILQLLAGCCGLSAIIVYGVERNGGALRWAYWLSVSGSSLFFMNGIGLIAFACATKCTMERQTPWKSDYDAV